MNCREARTEIALHLGHDESLPTDWEQARRHLTICPACRVHYRDLKAAMAVLDAADVEPTYEVRHSLWPKISEQLANPSLPTPRRMWAPVISFTIACLLFLGVWWNPPRDISPQSPIDYTTRSLESAPFMQGLNNLKESRERKFREQTLPDARTEPEDPTEAPPRK